MKVAADIDSPISRQVAALPWRRDKDGRVSVLLITSRTNHKWMLPKGWPIAGKSDAESALCEAREEAGIDGVISSVPIGSYAYIKLFDDGSTKPSRAVVFSLQVTSQSAKWDERHQRQRKWYRVEKAARLVYEPDLARLLAHVAAGRVVLAHPADLTG